MTSRLTRGGFRASLARAPADDRGDLTYKPNPESVAPGMGLLAATVRPLSLTRNSMANLTVADLLRAMDQAVSSRILLRASRWRGWGGLL